MPRRDDESPIRPIREASFLKHHTNSIENSSQRSTESDMSKLESLTQEEDDDYGEQNISFPYAEFDDAHKRGYQSLPRNIKLRTSVNDVFVERQDLIEIRQRHQLLLLQRQQPPSLPPPPIEQAQSVPRFVPARPLDSVPSLPRFVPSDRLEQSPAPSFRIKMREVGKGKQRRHSTFQHFTNRASKLFERGSERAGQVWDRSRFGRFLQDKRVKAQQFVRSRASSTIAHLRKSPQAETPSPAPSFVVKRTQSYPEHEIYRVFKLEKNLAEPEEEQGKEETAWRGKLERWAASLEEAIRVINREQKLRNQLTELERDRTHMKSTLDTVLADREHWRAMCTRLETELSQRRNQDGICRRCGSLTDINNTASNHVVSIKANGRAWSANALEWHEPPTVTGQQELVAPFFLKNVHNGIMATLLSPRAAVLGWQATQLMLEMRQLEQQITEVKSQLSPRKNERHSLMQESAEEKSERPSTDVVWID